MAQVDANAAVGFGYLLGLLPSPTRIADIKFPDFGTDLNQTPLEISFIGKDGKKVHLKIVEITIEVPKEESE